MSMMRLCCDCACKGDNCYQGYPAGCTHPCCHCTQIIGIDDCDPEYCQKLASCGHDGSVCSGLTFNATINYPDHSPRRKFELGGNSWDLEGTDKRNVFTNWGLGNPEGAGSVECTICDGEPCNDCSAKACYNCTSPATGFEPIQGYNFNTYLEGEVSEERGWFTSAGQVTITATYEGGCRWSGEATITDGGFRYYLTCQSKRLACGDPKVESTTMCYCDPCDCFEGGTNYDVCEESYQCNEWVPYCGQGGSFYAAPGSCEDGTMPRSWSCCSGPPNGSDGDYLCNGSVDEVWGVSSKWFCTYEATPVNIYYKVKYVLYVASNNPCDITGGTGWFQYVTFTPHYDFMEAFGQAAPPADGCWARPAHGDLLRYPNIGSCQALDCNEDCAPVCDEPGWVSTDCLPWKEIYHSSNNPCTCSSEGTWWNGACSCCEYEGDGTCVDPCGIVEHAEVKWGFKLDESIPLGEINWTCCGYGFSSSGYQGELYYNGIAPRAFSLESGEAVYDIPCNKLCPDTSSFDNDWTVPGWQGFRVQVDQG